MMSVASRFGLAAFVLASWPALSFADPLPPSQPSAFSTAWSAISPNAIYETGDAWIVGTTRYQLYGVQSCLRGTSFSNAHGVKRDCGEASLAMLASLVRDLKPLCYSAAHRADTKTAFVFCFAELADGPARGARIDLGTALITLGWAYAAIGPEGRAIHPPYAVAQQLAERDHAGLWAFADVENPNVAILRAYRASHGAAQRSQPTARPSPGGSP